MQHLSFRTTNIRRKWRIAIIEGAFYFTGGVVLKFHPAHAPCLAKGFVMTFVEVLGIVYHPKYLGAQQGGNLRHRGFAVGQNDETIVIRMRCHIVNGHLEAGTTTSLYLKCLLVLLRLCQRHQFALHHGVKHQHINLLNAIFKEGGEDALRRLAALAFQYSLNISFCKVFIYYMKSAKG